MNRQKPENQDMLQTAVTLQQEGRAADAIEIYDRLIASGHTTVETYYKRANALNTIGRWEDALADYDWVINLQPEHAKAYCNRGSVLERLNRDHEAVSSYDHAIRLDPRDFLAYYNRGSALRTLYRLSDALTSYDHAIALKGDFLAAHINRGNVLQELGRHDAAAGSYEKAISLDPNVAEAYIGLGSSLHALRRFAAAAASYERAYVLNPDAKYLPGLSRYAKMHICEWAGLRTDLERFREGLEQSKSICMPFILLAMSDSAPLQKLAAEIWVRDNHPSNCILGPIARKPPNQKIRVGYFSADFRNHPVSLLTAELFESHDRSRFEISAFAFGPDAYDAMRARLKKGFDNFIDVRGQTDQQVAMLARHAGIDIAVDLGGFTEHSRTNIFALRAAALQVSYIGYLGTMGASYIDYLVADHNLVTPADQEHYSEKIIYLPSYQVNDTHRHIADRTYTREELGLPSAGFVFCCFNSNYKITPDVFLSWINILKRVPGSIFFLYAENETVRRNMRVEATRAGIESSRFVFGERLEFGDYLARFRTMDLFLDTFPYNAGATASDALWAGLPMVTCCGQSFSSRLGASLLKALALPELVTNARADYEDLAVRLAHDPNALAAIKIKLESNQLTAPLFDCARFTRNFESALIQIHERHQAGFPAQHIYV